MERYAYDHAARYLDLFCEGSPPANPAIAGAFQVRKQMLHVFFDRPGVILAYQDNEFGCHAGPDFSTVGKGTLKISPYVHQYAAPEFTGLVEQLREDLDPCTKVLYKHAVEHFGADNADQCVWDQCQITGKAFVEYKGGEYYYVHESHSWDYGYGNSEFLWFVPKAVSKGVAPSGG